MERAKEPVRQEENNKSGGDDDRWDKPTLHYAPPPVALPDKSRGLEGFADTRHEPCWPFLLRRV